MTLEEAFANNSNNPDSNKPTSKKPTLEEALLQSGGNQSLSVSLGTTPTLRMTPEEIESYTDYEVPLIVGERGTWDEQRAQSQSGLSQLGRGVVNAATQLLFDTLGSTSYLLDAEQMINVARGTEQEYGNWFSDIMDKAQEATHMEVYRTEASKGFSPGTAGWWADAMPNIASGLSMIIPSMGAVKAASAVGKAIGLSKGLKAMGMTGNTLKGITGAVASRYMENTMEGHETFQITYQKALEAGATEEEARLIAADAAASNFNRNSALLLPDLLQYNALYKGFGKALSKSTGLKLAGQMLTEGGEEAYQFIAGQEAQRNALIKGNLVDDDQSTFGERMKDYASDPEFWNSAVLGSIGGGIFAGIDIYQENKAKRQYNNALGEYKSQLMGDAVGYDRFVNKGLVDHIVAQTAAGDLDKFETGLHTIKNNPDFAENPTEHVEVSKRIDNALALTNYAKIIKQVIWTESGLSDSLKQTKLKAAVENKASEIRLREINQELAVLETEDVAISKTSPELMALKRLGLTIEGLKNTPKFAEKVKELTVQYNKLKQDLFELYTKDIPDNLKPYKSAEEMVNSLSTSNDSALTNLYRNQTEENTDIKEQKDLLTKLKTPEGRAAFEAEVLNKQKEDAAKKQEEILKQQQEAAAQQQAQQAQQVAKTVTTTEEISDEEYNALLDTKVDAVEKIFEKIFNEEASQQEIDFANSNPELSKLMIDRDAELESVNSKEEADAVLKNYNNLIREEVAKKVQRPVKEVVKTETIPAAKPPKQGTLDIEAEEGIIGASLLETLESFNAEAQQIQENNNNLEKASQNLIAEKMAGIPDTAQALEFESVISEEKIGSSKEGIVMMQLFDHIYDYVKGTFKKFRWKRDNNGNLIETNYSGIKSNIVNNPAELAPGTQVYYELTPITNPEAKKIEEQSLQNVPEKDNPAAIASIGIYTMDGNLIGFYPLPRMVEVTSTNKNTFQTYVEARNKNLAEREYIYDKLQKGEKVTTTIKVKGGGNLITKLTSKGKVDLSDSRSLFNEIQIRDIDKIDGNAVFAYGSMDGKLEIPNMKITKELEDVLFNFDSYAKAGQVYLLLRDAANNFRPVPIYTNNITPYIATKIVEALRGVSFNAEPSTIINNINRYVFASLSEKANALQVRRNNLGNLEVVVQGNVYSLQAATNASQSKFIADLIKLKQNIDKNLLNTKRGESEFKSNRTIVSNIVSIDGNFFAQPYIRVNTIAPAVSLTKPATKTTTTPTVITPVSNIEVKKADIEKRRQEDIDKLFEKTQASVDKKLNTPVEKISKEEIAKRIEEAKEKNKDLIAELENPDFLNSKEREEEWDKKADDLSDKLPKGISWRVTNGKIEFFDDQDYREKGFGTKSIVPVTVSSIHNKSEKFEVGDRIQVNDGIRALPATVTKVNENGKILEARQDGGRLIISKGNIITTAPINERIKIDAKYDAELEALKSQPTEEVITDPLNDVNIAPDLNDEITYSRKDVKETKESRKKEVNTFNKWKEKVLPGLKVADEKEVARVKGTLLDAYGAFFNNLIYLFEGATNTTGYHEAFHGVFRNMLTDQERSDLINDAIEKYNPPTEEDLAYLKESSPKLSKEELTELYYEEKLADDFAAYIDSLTPLTFTKKIQAFFERIAHFFGLINRYGENSIESLFKRINEGQFRELSYNKIESGQTAYSLIQKLSAARKKEITEGIANDFIAQYLNKLNSGISPSEIKASEIFDQLYREVYLKKHSEIAAKFLQDPNSVPANIRAIVQITKDNYYSKDLGWKKTDSFVTEAVKLLNNRGIKISKKDQVNFIVEESAEEQTIDNEVRELEKGETKGFQEWTSIPGLRSATTRMKLFLSGIPVLENGKQVLNIFDQPIYVDFHKLYYYLERNLIGLYSLEEQIQKLKELAPYKPELDIVIARLETGFDASNNEDIERLRNDFKTNFSKQQLVYTLVIFESDSKTGKTSYKIMDANRQNISKDLYDTWIKNAGDITKNTIAELIDGEIKTFGTAKAKNLLKEWKEFTKEFTIVANPKEGIKAGIDLDKFDANRLQALLYKAGIEMSQENLNYLILKEPKGLVRNFTTVLEWYNSEGDSKDAAAGRKALANLVDYETNSLLINYTSSFNNVENKSIYTVQLPTFASKLMAELTNSDPNRMLAKIAELKKDPLYKYSNILNELENNPEFKRILKLSTLDGLKDARGYSEGTKFTNMSPKDFLAMQLGLFINQYANKNKDYTTKTSKYVYLTPADKSMATIFEAMSYDVAVTEDNKEVDPDSTIFKLFYNVALQEIERIKGQLLFKEMYEKASPEEKKQLKKSLKETYHYKKGSPIDAFDGKAFEFNYITTISKDLTTAIKKALSKDLTKEVTDSISGLETKIIEAISKELKNEVKKILKEAQDKKIIAKENGLYVNKSIDNSYTPISTGSPEKKHKAIIEILAKFQLNSLLHNIEMSQLLNGDDAFYKDLAKRTYQSNSFTFSGNYGNKKLKVILTKDHYTSVDPEIIKAWEFKLELLGYSQSEIEEITSAYKNDSINVTDATLYMHPNAYKAFLNGKGSWTADMEAAHRLAEANVPLENFPENLRGLLNGEKPFYFGNRFDENTNTQVYEQVKTFIIPLYNNFIENNEFLKKQKGYMEQTGADVLAAESAFKAALTPRESMENTNLEVYENMQLELDMNNFGIQQDNVSHIYDSENDAMRQVKMLILGNIDPNKNYGNKKGRDLIKEIDELEAENIKEDLDNIKKALKNPEDRSFVNMIQDAITARGATEVIKDSLEVLPDGTFKVSLDSGIVTRQASNLISSIFTNRVLKQSFKGGSAAQVTALGFKAPQEAKVIGQKEIEKKPEIKELQTNLKTVRLNKEGTKLEYAEAIMPAWTKEFFDENGFVKNINNIPEEARQLLAYRIPTEGFHSMLPIKVVAFLPETTGNFIILPEDITAQWGADFDFDKAYFLAPELKFTVDGNIDLIEYNPNRVNTKEGRNNQILKNYLDILTDPNILPYLKNPSGFEILKQLKEEITGTLPSVNYYSPTTQRDLKQRNHVGRILKGIAALHVTGHSYGHLLGLNIPTPADKVAYFKFNGIETGDLSSLYAQDGKTLISKEVSTMLAAILDDIKSPILQFIGINQHTINVWASIVRAGFGIRTGINFITQPAVKELSERLDENTYQIKDISKGRTTVQTLVKEYEDTYKKILNSIPPGAQTTLTSKTGNTFSVNAIEYLDKKFKNVNSYNLNDADLEKWREYQNFKNPNLTIETGINVLDNIELAEYYIYQIKVLNNFDRYKKVADSLTKINKFLAINKEVGPNYEDIIDATYLYSELADVDFLVQGVNNLNKIKGLKQILNTHKAALDFFDLHLPYSSDLYVSLKNLIAATQIKDTGDPEINILGLRPEKRDKINSFLSAFTSYLHDGFSSLNNEEGIDKLITTLPLLIRDIKNYKNDNTYNNGNTRKNPFIDQLKISGFKNDPKKLSISLKGGKLDPETKNILIEGLVELWRNPSTKNLALGLVKYSLASSGFYTGIGSYHDLISPEIMSEILTDREGVTLDFNEFKKQLVVDLNRGNMVLTPAQVERAFDQLIRNFPKDFTKIFDMSMFEKTEALIPTTLYTNDDLIDASNRTEDMAIKKENGLIVKYPKYIRVYNDNLKKPLIYKQDSSVATTYHLTTSLGDSGKFIEISAEQDLNTSVFSNNDNNPNKIVTVEADNYTEINEPTVIDFSGMPETNWENTFTDVPMEGEVSSDLTSIFTTLSSVEPTLISKKEEEQAEEIEQGTISEGLLDIFSSFTAQTPKTQTTPTVVTETPTGVEISSNAKGLAAALTNPTELAKSKGNLEQSYPVQYEGQTYPDAEAAYQTLKGTATKDEGPNSTYNLMVNIIKAKLDQYPRLVAGITKQGGSSWILSSTHQPTKQNTVWETGGKNWFIKALNEAYLTTQTPTSTNDVKVVSEAYGVVTKETNPSEETTKEFVNLIQPQIQKQAYQENRTGNKMFMFGLRWTRKSKALKPLVNKSYANEGLPTTDAKANDNYVYDTVDQNGNPLAPISDLQPIINEIETALGIDMSNYDAVIGNIYLPGERVQTHRDTTESLSARNYPVVVYTIGAGNAINVYEDEKNPGAISFASGKKITIPTKNGTIYTFGMDGKGRFELAHDTPAAIKKGNTLTPITMPDGKVIKDYTITLTFRRAADLTPGMPKSPTKPEAGVVESPSLEPGRYVKYKGEVYIVTKKNTSGTYQVYNPTKEGVDAKKAVAEKNLEPMDIKGKIVNYNNIDYIVTAKNTIISLTSNKVQNWPENNGNRIAILNLAKQTTLSITHENMKKDLEAAGINVPINATEKDILELFKKYCKGK